MHKRLLKGRFYKKSNKKDRIKKMGFAGDFSISVLDQARRLPPYYCTATYQIKIADQKILKTLLRLKASGVSDKTLKFVRTELTTWLNQLTWTIRKWLMPSLWVKVQNPVGRRWLRLTITMLRPMA